MYVCMKKCFSTHIHGLVAVAHFCSRTKKGKVFPALASPSSVSSLSTVRTHFCRQQWCNKSWHVNVQYAECFCVLLWKGLPVWSSWRSFPDFSCLGTLDAFAAAWTDAAVSQSMSSAHNSVGVGVCLCVLYFCSLSVGIFVLGLPPKPATYLTKPSLGKFFAGNCRTILQPLVETMVVSPFKSCAVCILTCSLRME